MFGLPDYPTVAEAIARTAEAYPNNGFTFQDLDGKESFHGFARMASEIADRSGALIAAGVGRGDRVGLIVIDPENFVLSFFAALRMGAVPVPMYPPMFLGSLPQYLEQTAAILRSAEACVAVVSADLSKVLWELVDRVPSLRRLLTAEELARGEAPARLPEVGPDDLAFLQYTSGSTAQPKGVKVSHRCLIANIHATSGAALKMHPDRDRGVSWLPLYHDMGLIGFCISPMYCGVNQVLIPPLRFIKNATVWMDAIHRHRATVSFAPNFAYALTAKRARPAQLEQWDLSCLKSLGCAAEPIHLGTLREFARVFARCGLKESVLSPAYGLAEATLALTMKPLDEPLQTRRVDAAHFQEAGVAELPAEGRPSDEHISCGVTFPGHEIAIFDEGGARRPDGVEGEVWARGPSIASGYYNCPERPSAVDEAGWLHTGDLGYLVEGQLYVTGRIKDLIILNGRNIHPQSLEWALTPIDGVRKGNVVAFSRPGPHSEELVIVAEAKPEQHAAVAEGIAALLVEVFSLRPADVVCLLPGSLPKTSSGKLQRQKVRRQYLSGSLGRERSRAGSALGRLSLARHVARSLWARAKASLRPR